MDRMMSGFFISGILKDIRPIKRFYKMFHYIDPVGSFFIFWLKDLEVHSPSLFSHGGGGELSQKLV